MRQPLLLTSLSLAVFLSASVLAQDQVPIQFQPDPVLTQTGTDAVFTVLTTPEVLSITWNYQGGVTLGLWAGGSAVVNPVAQFQGRVTITATQLRIGATQLRDAGTYTVEVIPSASTGLATNSRSIQLRVFDAVGGVSLFVPSQAVEGRNVSLRCTWTAGTGITVQWSKGGSVITADSRITISGGSLVINPARRSDAGAYTCNVSNPVSFITTTQSLTVFYGPDTPVVTVESPKECVGGGDVLVGQTVRLTCVSDSVPAALLSWQRDGQPVASGQPDSGVLSLQTFSTNESGRYVCVARNTVTEGTSEQSTDLAVVDVCFSGGEVAGIVIGAFLLLLIVILLIVLIVCLVQRRRALRQRETVPVRKENPNPRPMPPVPQPNGVRDLDQAPNPPLHYMNTYTRHVNPLHADPRENRGSPQTLPLNGLHNSDTQQHNGHIHTNGLLHNTIQNTNSYPHNGIDNPAFTHVDAQNTNTIPNTQQQNPNILIQTGQGGAQPSAVHVSLNTLPQTTQPNNNAQMPTIHVNLNSYSTNGQQALQDSSFPLTNTVDNNALEIQHNSIHTAQSSPRNRSRQSYPSDPRLTGHINTDHQPGLIPTGYTHYNDNNIVQRNANTQTYQQDPVPNRRSDRNSGRHEADPGFSHQQMPWDRLRGTPAYPSGTLQRAQAPPEYTSYTSDYTANPPRREARTPNRPEPRAQSQTTSRRRTPPRRDPSSTESETQSSSDDLRRLNAGRVTQLESSHRTQRSTHTQGERAQRDIRGLPSSQTAPRQEATHSNNPQALPLMSQHATVGRSAVSQGPTTSQGLTAPHGGDTRALADPNHLQQAHMAQQHRAVPIQTPPQGLGTQTQTAMHGATQPRQVGTAPPPYPSAQSNQSNLTQAALKAHTERAQTFKNRKQQTQAALLHPGPQIQASATGRHHPPTPPPVIPIAQFQTLPKERTHHRSPARGPQPPKPPVNMPAAQRQQQVHHRSNVQHHPTTKHTNHHHHHGNGHVHATAHQHAHVHGHPPHHTHAGQQQTHRGKPR